MSVCAVSTMYTLRERGERERGGEEGGERISSFATKDDRKKKDQLIVDSQ